LLKARAAFGVDVRSADAGFHPGRKMVSSPAQESKKVDDNITVEAGYND